MQYFPIYKTCSFHQILLNTSMPTSTLLLPFLLEFSPSLYLLSLLRKSIPFAKMYIDNSENFTPGVNQFPHCHSAETETHIYFCPKSPKPFDLLDFSRQQSDCLNGTFVVPIKFV